MIKAIVIASLAAVALAEAEADPYLLYGGLGYHGLGYGLAYGHLGYGYAHPYAYGKREAEAEPEAKPEAEADPYLLYEDTLDMDTSDTMAMDSDTTDTARGL